MKCVKLNNETVKIFGVLFSYNKNLEQDKNFREPRKYCQNRKHFTIIVDDTVNFRRKN